MYRNYFTNNTTRNTTRIQQLDFIKQQNNTFPKNYSKTSIKHKSNKLKYTFLFAQRFETRYKLNPTKTKTPYFIPF